jgi:GNAT superfamily N-acetyltransferase
MTALDADAVLRAAGQWVWAPDEATQIETDDFLLVAFPDHYPSPTQLPRTHSSRPAQDLLADVRSRVSGLGRSTVEWCVHDRTRPQDLEEALVVAGARINEELLVLARPLAGWEATASSVEVRPVSDRATLEDWYTVQVQVFGGSRPDGAALDHELARATDGLAAGTATSVVGYHEGEPVGSAGISLVDGWARLWGGSTLPQARGRGVYRAMTDFRAAWAGEHGATAALVKGRVDTSAPILSRAGFTSYGEERWYLLEL